MQAPMCPTTQRQGSLQSQLCMAQRAHVLRDSALHWSALRTTGIDSDIIHKQAVTEGMT